MLHPTGEMLCPQITFFAAIKVFFSFLREEDDEHISAAVLAMYINSSISSICT